MDRQYICRLWVHLLARIWRMVHVGSASGFEMVDVPEEIFYGNCQSCIDLGI